MIQEQWILSRVVGGCVACGVGVGGFCEILVETNHNRNTFLLFDMGKRGLNLHPVVLLIKYVHFIFLRRFW